MKGIISSIEGKAAETIKSEAALRGVTSAALVRAIVVMVVRDGMIDAVLDGADVRKFQKRRPRRARSTPSE